MPRRDSCNSSEPGRRRAAEAGLPDLVATPKGAMGHPRATHYVYNVEPRAHKQMQNVINRRRG